MPGEIQTCQSTINMLCQLTGSVSTLFLLLDLHNSGIIHYFNNTQAMELYAQDTFCSALRELYDFSKEDIVFGTTDLGRPKWVSKYANEFGVEMVLCCSPKENQGDLSEALSKPVGEVKGKHIIIFDDMMITGETLFNAIDKYMSNGATKITVMVSHFNVSDESVVKRIEECKDIDVFLTTNSHSNTEWECVKNSKKIKVLDITPLFTNQILKVFNKNVFNHASPFLEVVGAL